ncbi:hypothetical protein ACERK3_11235 [Phycisphaerales bacterium AB-hyl4]|uniref:D-galactarate/Altronate dehydratase C-terminal domain-containing protein n=1 Tax=Natronomicrosphaera hydrolytica TaxID=3242702 RepID=A0ABV4U6C5_9BACT
MLRQQDIVLTEHEREQIEVAEFGLNEAQKKAPRSKIPTPASRRLAARCRGTYERMIDDMDFNAGRVLSGEQTLDAAAAELQQLVIDVASGTPSKPEALGHREYFVMYKHQDTPPLSVGCRV